MDLIKTIEDDEEVENLSEDSDVEIEVEKTKKNPNFFHIFAVLVSTDEAEAPEEGAF